MLQVLNTETMNRVILMAGLVLSIAVLLTSPVVPFAEAAQLKDKETINGVVFDCRANRGIITCSMKSATGGTVKSAGLVDSDAVPNVCDSTGSAEKKRLSVTNRKSLCGEFITGEIYHAQVDFVDGGLHEDNGACIEHFGNSIVITEAPSQNVQSCDPPS